MTTKTSRDEIIKKIQIIYVDRIIFDDKFQPDGVTKKSIMLCADHGYFVQSPREVIRGHGCKNCGYLRTGEVSRLSRKDIIAKIRAVHGDKIIFDDNFIYCRSDKKAVMLCGSDPHHGYFSQRPACTLSGQGCPKCGVGRRISTSKLSKEEIIQKIQAVHGDKILFDEMFQPDGTKPKATMVCPIHGHFSQRPNDTCDGHGCPKCGRDNAFGHYSEEFFSNNPHKKDNYGKLYLVQIEDGGEIFYKIGITTKSLSERFNNLPYQYIIIFEKSATLYTAFRSEQQLLNELSSLRYIPSKKFSGWTECFLFETIIFDRFVEEITHEHNSKTIR